MEKKLETMKLEDAKKIILSSEGKVFIVQFIKRSTGELRTMHAQIGVSKDLKGVGQAFNPDEKGLITVYDTEKKAYRMINLGAVVSIKVKARA